MIYRDGISVRRVTEEQIVPELVKEIEAYVEQHRQAAVPAGEPTD